MGLGDSFIGNYSSTVTDQDGWLGSNLFSADPVMRNSPDPMPPMPMYGRTTPLFREPVSSSVSSPVNETPSATGMQSGQMRLLEIYLASTQQCLFSIIGVSGPSLPTTLGQLLSLNAFMSFGVALVRGNLDGHGTKPEWMLTAKIQDPSFGVVTTVIEKLWWMNFEVVSILHTSSDGQTDTLVTLNLKDLPPPYWLMRSGLHQMQIPAIGILISILKLWLLYYVVWILFISNKIFIKIFLFYVRLAGAARK